jgi:pyruvate dehydrogenase E1 component
VPYLTQVLAEEPWPVIAASDYMKMVADQVARFVPAGLYPLGTDGFGRSDTRDALRRFFEVDAAAITVAALSQLARRGAIEPSRARAAIEELGVEAETPDPSTV